LYLSTLSDKHTSRNLPDKGSIHRTDLYLTTHNILNRKTFLPPGGFEPVFSASKLPQTYILDGETTRIGWKFLYQAIYSEHLKIELTSNSNTVFETALLLCAL
jgi:hypothetical protein